MNIEEIRAEIPKAYITTYRMRRWLAENGVEDAYSMEIADVIPTIARMLIDRAYEAGLKRGGEISLSALNDVELRGNPIYQKGYDAGKFEGQKGSVLFDVARQVGFDEAAKDPKAWYVLDKNGEPVHIGDWCNSPKWSDDEIWVEGLGDGVIIGSCTGNLDIQCNDLEKVIPDTREKIKEELIRCFAKDTDEVPDDITCGDLAEQFIARIEALVD